MKTTLKHFVRYTGNNNDQYVMNQAGYLSYSGEGTSKAMDFKTITAANDWAWAANKIIGRKGDEFVVESVEVVNVNA